MDAAKAYKDLIVQDEEDNQDLLRGVLIAARENRATKLAVHRLKKPTPCYENTWISYWEVRFG